jgi:hypothetical protein
MHVPTLLGEQATQTSLALVCKLMDALVAKGVITRADVDGVFSSVIEEFERDTRYWGKDAARNLNARPKG